MSLEITNIYLLFNVYFIFHVYHICCKTWSFFFISLIYPLKTSKIESFCHMKKYLQILRCQGRYSKLLEYILWVLSHMYSNHEVCTSTDPLSSGHMQSSVQSYFIAYCSSYCTKMYVIIVLYSNTTF